MGTQKKVDMEQASGFFSNETLNFCNYEGIELIKTPVKDHCATGMVERTIGSMKILSSRTYGNTAIKNSRK